VNSKIVNIAAAEKAPAATSAVGETPYGVAAKNQLRQQQQMDQWQLKQQQM